MPDERLKKLEGILNLVEPDKITRKEFDLRFEDALKAFKTYLDTNFKGYMDEMSQIKVSLDDSLTNCETDIGKLQTYIDQICSKLSKDYAKELRDLSSSFFSKLDSLKSSIPVLPDLSKLENKMNQIVIDLESKIPIIEEITPEKIRDKLELLKGDNRLDKSAIKGLEDLEKEIQTLKKKKGFSLFGGGGGTSGGGKIVKAYDISSQLNGVLKTFSIPANYRVIAIHASSFPFSAFRPTIDYTNTDSSITFTTEISALATLGTGQSVLVEYAEAS